MLGISFFDLSLRKGNRRCDFFLTLKILISSDVMFAKNILKETLISLAAYQIIINFASHVQLNMFSQVFYKTREK
jgi:hypothetical protein